MSRFCEVLADTGLVVDACLAVGKSTNTAYATRRRNPLFAAAWEAALTIARDRLADTLLARSIEGVTEQYYRNGELVGEKKVIDSRLGLAILRRLDRLADTGRAAVASVAPARAGPRFDWDLALAALHSGEADAVAEALAMFNGTETHEAHDPPMLSGDNDSDDAADRCRMWQDEDEWMTDYPPPAGFDGYAHGEWGMPGYKRECSAAETALIEAVTAEDRAARQYDDAARRDDYFTELAEWLQAGACQDDPDS